MSTYIIAKRHIERLKKKKKLPPRLYRIPETSAFALEDDEFQRLFCLSKKNVRSLCQCLHKELVSKCGTQFAIPVEIKILCALRFFVTGSLQKDVGKDETLNISQAAVSRCVISVSQAICKKILPSKISFSSSIPNSQVAFSNIAGFPGTIGAISCHHIPIATENNPQNAYLNNKGQHSINVLFVCDTNFKFTHVNASFPGASMDWFVWKYSKLHALLASKGIRDSWLVASAKFQPEPWLLTPFEEPSCMSEWTYNLCHEETLKVIYKCIRMLKKRFGCLRSVLRVSPEVAERIIETCAVLHNICVDESPGCEDVTDENEDLLEPIDENAVFVPLDDALHVSAIEQRRKVAKIYESL